MRGSLFTRDFLEEGIAEQPEWLSLSDDEVGRFAGRAEAIFDEFPVTKTPNEPVTETDLIHKVVEALGWKSYLPQQHLSPKGRRDVPDLLLFAGPQDKADAQAESQSHRKFLHGVAIVESKRWLRPLDQAGPDGTPSSQILRYLNRAAIQSERRIKWGILTNGRHWRLYWHDAKSQLEDFLELDLPMILGIKGIQPELFSAEQTESPHHLRLFYLLFRRQSFLPGATDRRSFHLRAIDETRRWEARVADDLSAVVFDEVFPNLVRALIRNDPARTDPPSEAYLDEVGRAALALLYRLLFVLYAEDRNLLPVRDRKYDDYALYRIRQDIAQRIDGADDLSTVQDRYYTLLKSLFRAIDSGDPSIGLPPYNGGLFQTNAFPLLERVSLPDADMAPAIDAISRRREEGRRKIINYRDLSVQQLGSIYERLLEHVVALDSEEPQAIVIRPNIFARKGSGSYYTPDDLVGLIVERALGPLIEERWQAFADAAAALRGEKRPRSARLTALQALDPATALLGLKVCDPAMGSGHFLVFAVDFLADTILRFAEEAAAVVDWAGKDAAYESPLLARIAGIRERIVAQAAERGWTIDKERLEPRHIVRRMILKRVIYGVDKNPMAVELAKVSLWLHTFTVGAPLSFLDHHLRVGDSLFGEFVRPVEDALEEGGFAIFIKSALHQAKNAAKGMAAIEEMTDADIAEVVESAERFRQVEADTGPLAKFLDFVHAARWLGKDIGRNTDGALGAILDGHLGPQLDVVAGRHVGDANETAEDQGSLLPEAAPRQISMKPLDQVDADTRAKAVDLLRRAAPVAARERFFHWQVAFPGVWDNWESRELAGGFDAIIGNPPWDRIKLQEVEWFAERRPAIARQARASDRRRLIAALEDEGDPLWQKYLLARDSAESASRVARTCGAYPLLSRGDINLYALFVERAASLVGPDGMVGLLVPSGIAADKGASAFFKGVATGGRLAALLDFENRKVFFPDIHASFKFCVFVTGGAKRRFESADCAFFLHAIEELSDPGRAFALAAEDFARVNPNTGTAPIFRTRRDVDITRGVYERLPVLHDHEKGKVWPVRYFTMFHLTNDAHLFRTRAELDAEGYYRVSGNRMKKGNEECCPLLVGRMIHQFDHRAAGVDVNEKNIHNAALSVVPAVEDRADPNFFPAPQYWVSVDEILWPGGPLWALGFRDIARSTDARTVISSLVPRCAAGNTLPLIVPETTRCDTAYEAAAVALSANMNSFVFDYVARQKVQSTHLNWYIVEQLPVVPPERYETRFGPKTAWDFVRDHVLPLTYTASDMKPFAEDIGYAGDPFVWDEEDRRRRRAILDALFFLLYGVEDEGDVRYILDTFPIIRRDDESRFGSYRTQEMIVQYMRALVAGDPDAEIDV